MTEWISTNESRRLTAELGPIPDHELQPTYKAFGEWARLAETLESWRSGLIALSWDSDRGRTARPIDGGTWAKDTA